MAQLVRVSPRKQMVVSTPKEAALGELCCIALSFCCVALLCLSKHLKDD